MSYPTTIDTPGTTMVGTTLLTGDDHSLEHREVGTAIINIESLLGTTAASNGLFNSYTAGQTPLPINSGTLGTVVSKGTFNNGILGSMTATGGTFSAPTITGAGTNSGTISGGVYGTATIQGGTYINPNFQVYNGWVLAGETGTMLGTLSANGIITGTLTVQATASSKYDKGDKLNFTQGGTNMYAYVYSIPTGTTLLITGGTDYALGTTAVTNLLYSKAESPNGFPGTFNYTANETWSGTAPTGNTLRSAQFYMRGNLVYYIFNSSYGTAGSVTKLTINQPVPSLTSSSTYHDYGNGWLNNATNASFSGVAVPAVLFSNTIIQMGPTAAQGWQATFINGFYAV